MARQFMIAWVCVIAMLSGAGLAAPGAPEGPTPIVGNIADHVVVPGDTVRSLSARFGVSEAAIAADNRLAANRRLIPGQHLHIDTRHLAPAEVATLEIVINIPQRYLFHSSGGSVRKAYPVAVGRADWPTPVGAFTVLEKEEQPAWDVPVSIQEEMRRLGQPVRTMVPPGPENPLGDFFIRLSFSAVGLHGTTAPDSIYRSATHGCIRLHPEDIADLFPHVQIGAEGRIVYQPILLALTDDGILLEAHPDIYRRGPANPLRFVQQLAETRGLSAAIDWRAVREVLTRRAGTPRSVSLRASQDGGGSRIVLAPALVQKEPDPWRHERRSREFDSNSIATISSSRRIRIHHLGTP